MTKKRNFKHYLLIFLMGFGVVSNAQTWETIASDGAGDGAAGSLLDGTELAYWYDSSTDSLWFKLKCASITGPQASNLGFNIMVKYPGGGSTFNFWGWDNTNSFNKIVTGWITGSPPSSYSGTIGIANSTGVASSNFENLHSDNLSIEVNTADATIIVGMKRDDLIPDTALDTDIITAAAVGSSVAWNDDIYSASGTMNLMSTASVSQNYSVNRQFTTYPNPVVNKLEFNIPTSYGFNKSLPLNVQIIDLKGSVLIDERTGHKQIEMMTLPSGVYILKITQEGTNEQIISKILKS